MATQILVGESGLIFPSPCPSCGASTFREVSGRQVQSRISLSTDRRLPGNRKLVTYVRNVPLCWHCRSQQRKAGLVAVLGHLLGMVLGAIGALVMVGALYGDSGGSRPSTAVSLAVLVMLLVTEALGIRLGWVFGKVVTLKLLWPWVKRGARANHAITLRPTDHLDDTRQCWLVIQDDDWAQQVQGGLETRPYTLPSSFMGKVGLILTGDPFYLFFK